MGDDLARMAELAVGPDGDLREYERHQGTLGQRGEGAVFAEMRGFGEGRVPF